jgi:hypothetical protein
MVIIFDIYSSTNISQIYGDVRTRHLALLGIRRHKFGFLMLEDGVYIDMIKKTFPILMIPNFKCSPYCLYRF